MFSVCHVITSYISHCRWVSYPVFVSTDGESCNDCYHTYKRLHCPLSYLTSSWFVSIIYIIFVWRAKPGLYAAPKLCLSAIFGVVWPRHVAPWPIPSPTWALPFVHDQQNRLESTFLMHFSVKIRWWSDNFTWIQCANILLFLSLYNRTTWVA